MKIPVTAFYHTHMLLFIEDYRKYPGYWYTNLPGFMLAARWLLRFVYNAYDLTMVPSSVTFAYLKGLRLNNLYHDHFIGVDPNVFSPGPGWLKKKQGPIRILNISRYDPDKQVDTLLAVCGAIDEAADCFFTFVGHGLEDGKISRWAEQRANARFAGSVSNRETAAFYKMADIFITAADKENHSVCVLEAMACGLPVVGPDRGGVKGMVEHGKTGMIVPAGDVDAYVKAVCQLVRDDDLRQAMAGQSYKKARQHSSEEAARNMVRVWERLVK